MSLTTFTTHFTRIDQQKTMSDTTISRENAVNRPVIVPWQKIVRPTPVDSTGHIDRHTHPA